MAEWPPRASISSPARLFDISLEFAQNTRMRKADLLSCWPD
jgi:hypothetical protein